MSAATATATLPARRQATGTFDALGTLTGRRFHLSARTPRELFVPLLTPIMFALVIAPALKSALHTDAGYESYVALGTIGLLIPLNTMFSGIGVIVDRENGARRELLTAPVPRSLLVVANLAVALAITGLQLAALTGAAVLRGVHFHPTAAGIGWSIGAAGLFAVGMYGAAEILAARVPRQEEYIAAVPAIAIVPWFFAGSLFPITALPVGMTWFARFLPLTHALALIRYGLLGDHGSGLHDIWGTGSTSACAALSLGVVAAFATVFTAVSIRVFTRSAVT